jgi:hypothetical protein
MSDNIVTRKLRLLCRLHGEITAGSGIIPRAFQIAPGIFEPEDIRIEPNGQVSIRNALVGWMELKPEQFEWLESGWKQPPLQPEPEPEKPLQQLFEENNVMLFHHFQVYMVQLFMTFTRTMLDQQNATPQKCPHCQKDIQTSACLCGCIWNAAEGRYDFICEAHRPKTGAEA